MEEQMNYFLMPSLQRRALIKTVITVWNQDDVRNFITEFDFESDDLESNNINYFSEEKRQKVEDIKMQVVEDCKKMIVKVIEKVQMLPLPESLKKSIADLVTLIFLEALHWWRYHRVFLFDSLFVKENLKKICWTPQGTIDKKKTAEALIRDENLNIRQRYEIACTYCLENDILMLWNKMPEHLRNSFDYKYKYAIEHPLILLWTLRVKGEVIRMSNFPERWTVGTPYQYAIELGAKCCNKAALEYFLPKLTSDEERDMSLVGSALCFCLTTHSHISHTADVLCFLLSQMNEKQQVEVLGKYPRRVLMRLLDCWPWQCFFMAMAERVWEFLSPSDFCCLLQLIIKKVKDGFKDYNYHKLFRDFWIQSPIILKNPITNTHRNSNVQISGITIRVLLLIDLLKIRDKENVELILGNLCAPDKEKIIISIDGMDICVTLVCNDEMDLLEFFVQECLSTKDIMTKFSEEFEKHIIQSRTKEMLEKEKDMWSKAFQLLDNLTQKYDKMRCVEDGNNFTAKRFCSLTS